MAKIPLRSYHQEIERLIESGRTDEASAHCRYILESYPKYADTYRLLGKAFLESQRYGDAADIFQRVLSCMPEDFVAHVGMSMIREDEGNLDEAIWHMERAFEIQPANSAIQDELRRLYGQRDGFEPPKMRLTRGALARMYAKGDLYQQALAEIRAALAETPNRIDLQLLMAEIYAGTSHRVEAVEAANTVLRKLPNCISANLIMFTMLLGTERDEEAKVFQQRLQQLTPYAAYLSPNALSLEDIPDQAVAIEKLEWKPGQAPIGSSGQPEWATSLGVNLGDFAPSSEEALPEWLSDASQEQPAKPRERATVPVFAPGDAQTPEAEAQEAPIIPSDESEEEIPDWMKAAGWRPDTGAFDESKVSLVKEQEETGAMEEPELAAAEIPEWLQAMAPAQGEAEARIEEETEEEIEPWLDQILPPTSKPQEAAIEADDLAAEELPDWMKGDEETAAFAEEIPDWLKADESAPAAESGEGIPEWLRGAQELAGQASPGEPAAEIGVEEGLPGWLSETVEETAEAAPAEMDISIEAEAEAAPAEELPAWLFEEEPPAAEQGVALEAEAETAPAEELPAWLFEEEPPAEQGVALEAETEAAPAEELPAWLFEEEAPAAEQGVALEAEAEAAPAEELPAWLFEEEAPAAEQGVALEVETEAAPAEELPAWLFEEEAPAAEQGVALEAEAEAAPAEELPAWLFEEEAPAAKAETVSLEDTQPSRAARSEAAPTWPPTPPAGAELAEELPEAPPEEAPATEIAPAVEAMPEAPLDEEAAFAWLESLAVKQGAD
ncbi:MAG: hypothetical protein JXA78_05675, partial [Anaerolineales bacterium]|nr:hypothetical protein [Anaerolineales bacterium]